MDEPTVDWKPWRPASLREWIGQVAEWACEKTGHVVCRNFNHQFAQFLNWCYVYDDEKDVYENEDDGWRPDD